MMSVRGIIVSAARGNEEDSDGGYNDDDDGDDGDDARCFSNHLTSPRHLNPFIFCLFCFGVMSVDRAAAAVAQTSSQALACTTLLHAERVRKSWLHEQRVKVTCYVA